MLSAYDSDSKAPKQTFSTYTSAGHMYKFSSGHPGLEQRSFRSFNALYIHQHLVIDKLSMHCLINTHRNAKTASTLLYTISLPCSHSERPFGEGHICRKLHDRMLQDLPYLAWHQTSFQDFEGFAGFAAAAKLSGRT